MDYRSMAKSASSRRSALQSRIASTKVDLAAMEKELVVLDGLLKAIPAGTSRRSPSPRRKVPKSKSPRSKKPAKKGKWKPGKPGRPPKWYLEQQKGKGGKAPRKAAGRPAKKPKVKRKASEKQLASMARAREALAAKRAAARASPSGQTPGE